jgi:hypothetical protein
MSSTYLSGGAENVSAPARSALHSPRVGEVPRDITSNQVVFEPPSFGELSQTFPHLKILALIRHDERGGLYLARYRQTWRGAVFLEIMPQSCHQPFARVKALLKKERPTNSRIREFGRVNGFVFLVLEREKRRLIEGIALWLFNLRF